MGKVIKRFEAGSAGAISRSVDDVVVAFANRDTAPIAFGAPVFLAADRQGVVNVSDSADFTKFLGVAVRNPSKTPDTYGSQLGSYAPGDVVDVLVRGSVVVKTAGSPYLSAPVYLVKSTGRFSTAPGAEGTTLPLTNCVFRGVKDSVSNAEMLITARNIT